MLPVADCKRNKYCLVFGLCTEQANFTHTLFSFKIMVRSCSHTAVNEK